VAPSRNVTGSAAPAPLFSVGYAIFYSSLVSTRNPIVCDGTLCATVIAGTRRTQGNKAQPSWATTRATCNTDFGSVLHASILVQARTSARRRCCGLLTGRLSAIREAANMPRIRRGGTLVRVQLNQAGYRPRQHSPAEWSRIRSHPRHRVPAPSSPCPRAAGPPTGRSPLFRRISALQRPPNRTSTEASEAV
jgi:hypothetical protein